MEVYMPVLKTSPLFAGLDDADIRAALACLGAKRIARKKKQHLFRSGDRLTSLGVVLSGAVQIYQEDYYGNRNVFGNIGPGGLFGESFACAAIDSVPVSAVASEAGEMLFLDCRRLATPCENACGFHARLIRNLMDVLARKNVALTQRLEFTGRRTTREKALAYLFEQARLAGSSRFSIPFDRQELADYLCVERSGLSSELAKLRDEGVIQFHKNEFELLDR